MIVSSLLNVGLTIFLIKIIGPIGAAISTALAIILGNGIYLNYVYYKKIHINIYDFFRNVRGIWFIGVLMLPIGYLINLLIFSNHYLSFGIHIFLFIFIYSLLLFSFILSKNERDLILHKIVFLWKR